MTVRNSLQRISSNFGSDILISGQSSDFRVENMLLTNISPQARECIDQYGFTISYYASGSQGMPVSYQDL